MGEEQKVTLGVQRDLWANRVISAGQFAYDANELIDELPIAIYCCDKDGRITFYNAAAAEVWGSQPQIGTDLFCGSCKIYKDDGVTLLPVDEWPVAITLKEQRAVKGQILIERPDGIRLNILAHSKPYFDENGKLTGAVDMLTDITQKKQQADQITESAKSYQLLSQYLEQTIEERTSSVKKNAERYHKMIEEVEDYAIILLDRDGFILDWNKGAEKIKGYSESEIIGQNFRVFYLEKDQLENLPEQLIELARKNGKATHEGWRVRKDRTSFWGNIVITALHDEYNNIIGFSKVTRDLTERKLAEDQLRKYAQELQIQNRQLEEYAYVASHDLQEPLRKIKTFAYQLKKELNDRVKMEKSIEKIQLAAERMTSLIKNVLDYSQLSDPGVFFTAIDLNEVLQTVKEDFELLIKEKQAIIVSADLPCISGIPIQLYQLFSNLIANAIKFSTQFPLIEIYSENVPPEVIENYPELDTRKNYAKLIFKDNGMGFDQKYTDQIFKLFQRLSTSTYGTGIGLALCKKIVENHKGHISVESQINHGSIFTIILPMPY